jgi:hypothetical protein
MYAFFRPMIRLAGVGVVLIGLLALVQPAQAQALGIQKLSHICQLPTGANKCIEILGTGATPRGAVRVERYNTNRATPVQGWITTAASFGPLTIGRYSVFTGILDCSMYKAPPNAYFEAYDYVTGAVSARVYASIPPNCATL